MVINYYSLAVQGSVDVMSPVSLEWAGGVRGGTDSGPGGCAPGPLEDACAHLVADARRSQVWGGGGERGTLSLERSPLSEESKFPVTANS